MPDNKSIDDLKDESCQLVFLFKLPPGESLDVLEKEVSRSLSKHFSKNPDEVPPLQEHAPSRFRLTIESDLATIDACRHALESDIPSRFHPRRLTDGASRILRRAAYPIVADIEEQLRKFVDRRMIDSLGIDWWSEIDDSSDLYQRTHEVQGKHSPSGYPARMLDFSHFSDLVDLLTMNRAHRSRDEPISVGELLEWSEEFGSLDKLHAHLKDETREQNLWDDVFGEFFENKSVWSDLRQDLEDRVIPTRHAVMHHRPIRLWEYRELTEYSERFHNVLDRALELDDDAQEDVRKHADDMFSGVLSLVELSNALEATSISEALNQQSSLQDAMKAEAARPNLSEALETTSISEALNQQSSLQDVKAAAARPDFFDTLASLSLAELHQISRLSGEESRQEKDDDEET